MKFPLVGWHLPAGKQRHTARVEPPPPIGGIYATSIPTNPATAPSAGCFYVASDLEVLSVRANLLLASATWLSAARW